MIQKNTSTVNNEKFSLLTNKLRTKLHTLRPANAPHIVAGVLYHDPALGVVLHSIRGAGIHEKSRAIQFDASVINDAENCGCTVVEVATGGMVYSATMKTIYTRGRYVNTKFGLQVALALKWWSTGGVDLPKEQTQPTHSQLNLFSEVGA